MITTTMTEGRAPQTRDVLQMLLDASESFATGHTMLVSDTPQARFDEVGGRGMSDSELLALMLTGAGVKTKRLATQMLSLAGSLGGLANWVASDFANAGVSKADTRRLAVVVEMARRMTSQTGEAPVLNRPELIAAHMKPHVLGLTVEKFWVLCLNRKNRLIRMVEVTSGTATSSLAHPREVFREAIKAGATAVVCAHNHPSGDPAPSAADVQVTRQLRDAAKAVDIDLLDHLVLGRAEADPQGRGYYSFREAGLI